MQLNVLNWQIVQDIIERGQKQISGVNEQPLIQINQQTNSVNVSDEAVSLSRESRERVKNVVTDLLRGIGTDAQVIEATPVEEKKND